MYCANCLQEITDDGYVRCSNTKHTMHGDCSNPCVECGEPLTDAESIANNFKCNKCNDKNAVEIDFVRRSYIEDYKTCPYKFKLQAVDGKRGPNNPYAMNGIILHDLFEKGAREKDYTIDLMKEEYTKLYEGVDGFKDYMIKRNVPKNLFKNGMVCIDNFYIYHEEVGEPFAIEETIQYEIAKGMPKIQITFDRIQKDEDGKLHLIDYKTGKVTVGKELASNLQVPTYIKAVEAEYGVLPETFKLLFLGEDKERVYYKRNKHEYVCTVGKREYVQNLPDKISEIKSVFSKVRRGLFQIPFGELSPWYCENRCGMYETYCQGVNNQSWGG